MDLLQTVRKEGSRGGVNFSWDDVKDSQHRENYLGHSIMAPVGRWQKNKDLSWYAKADDADLTAEEKLEKEQQMKKEELRKVKEAEEDAMAKALGLPVPDRSNANEEPLGMSREKQAEVNRALKQALGDDPEDTYQPSRPKPRREGRSNRSRERDTNERGSNQDYRTARSRRHSRSRSRDIDREKRHSRRHHVRSRSRSRDRVQRRRSRSRDRRHVDEKSRRHMHSGRRPRSRDHVRDRDYDRSRSRSPYESRRYKRD